MGVVEFELLRTVQAPVAQVFARLADIAGYDEWMPRKGSLLRRTQQTSPGEPGLGTTYLDATLFGPAPGEIVEFQPPHTLVFHWWNSSRGGKVKVEGWPGYSMEAEGTDRTLVRHHARLQTYGSYRLATPVLRRIARRERTTTIEALEVSFSTRA